MPPTKEAIQLMSDTALEASGKSLNTFAPTAILPDGAKVLNMENTNVAAAAFVEPTRRTPWPTSAPTCFTVPKRARAASSNRTR
jgi:hypothetical protein